MSTMLNLKTRTKIEGQIDHIIERAEKLIDSTKIAGKEAGLEQSQLRNLQNLASSTDSFKAVELFIQYQMGRERRGGMGWLHGDFGSKLIGQLHQLDPIAETISQETNAIQADVRMELVRLFIGYMTRYFSYRSSPQSGAEEQTS
jgi:hypothetical protein